MRKANKTKGKGNIIIKKKQKAKEERKLQEWISRQNFQKFKEELNKINWDIIEVEGDGNCLFRSICHQLEGSEINYKHYRKQAVLYMKENKTHFQMFISEDNTIDEYICNIEKDGEWGGNLEIYAVAMSWEANFYIYIYNHPMYSVKNFLVPKHELFLSYHEGEHYNSWRKIDDKDVNNLALGVDQLNI